MPCYAFGERCPRCGAPWVTATTLALPPFLIDDAPANAEGPSFVGCAAGHGFAVGADGLRPFGRRPAAVP
jgi:hypothetical protein